MDTDPEPEAPEYAPPLDRLLAMGKPEAMASDDWLDYATELDLGPQHIPDLIRMATDEDLRWGEEEDPAIWGPLHAWRALGRLRAEEAIEPLLVLLDSEDDDWAGEEVPDTYSMIGPAAIPALRTYLADAGQDMYARANAATALTRMAERHAESRAQAVATLTEQLARFDENEEELNAFLVGELADLLATEALPVIEQAFAAGRVDPSITSWDYTQFEFGLITQEELDRRLPPPMPLSLPRLPAQQPRVEKPPRPRVKKQPATGKAPPLRRSARRAKPAPKKPAHGSHGRNKKRK